jgi:hypothetical protein
MSVPGPGHEKRSTGQSTAGRRSEVSVRLTASDILSLAVNCRQNGWGYPDWLVDVLGCDSTGAVDAMLDEIYEQVLEANHKAVERRLAKRVRQEEE